MGLVFPSPPREESKSLPLTCRRDPYRTHSTTPRSCHPERGVSSRSEDIPQSKGPLPTHPLGGLAGCLKETA